MAIFTSTLLSWPVRGSLSKSINLSLYNRFVILRGAAPFNLVVNKTFPHHNLSICTRKCYTSKSLVRHPMIPVNNCNTNLTRSPISGYPPCRRLSETSEFKNFIGPKTEQRLQQSDRVPKTYTMIYRSTFSNYLLSTQLVLSLLIGTCIFTAITFGLNTISPETPEEKEARKQKIKEFHEKRREEERKSALAQLSESKGWTTIKDVMPARPEPDQLTVEDDPRTAAVLTLCFLSLGIALYKIMGQLPIRIYINNKNAHCIAIYYGSILPGRKTQHEFVAGTVRKANSKVFYSNTMYEDGSGRKFVLMDHFFRYPSDLERLLEDVEEKHLDDD